MKKNTKVTLAQLIDRAEQRKENKVETKKFYVESLGGYVIARKPLRHEIEEMVESEAGDELVVYECVVEPNLKNTELLKQVKRPLDIVGLVFEPGEVSNLARKILSMAGYGSDSVEEVNEVENLKN